MKTSNIILTAVFASILIWIFAAFMTAKAKMKQVTGWTNNSEEVFTNKEAEKQTLSLENFSGINVEGTGWVSLKQSSENKLTHYSKDEYEVEIKGDVLNIKIHDFQKGLVIHANSVNKILTQEKISLTIYGCESDTIKINTKDKSEINVKGIDVKFIQLKSEGKSEAHFHNINKTVAEAEFEIKDKSTVTINNTKGMSISVKKDSDAKYQDY